MRLLTKTAGIFAAIVFICLALSARAPAADDPFMTDEEIRKSALDQVKTDLLQKLRAEGHEGLADQLSGINPEKIGDFLGSAAGGDFDQAFNIAGSSAAKYLNEKFEEKLNEKLGQWIQPNSPAAIIGKYVPWDSAQAKQIAISAIRGKFSAAGDQLTAMVKTKGRANLEQASKDIIAYGIDWVLKPTVGAGAGQLFIKTVELEIAGIEWFKKWSADYLTEKRRNQYSEYRKQGMTPKEAAHKINKDSGFTAFARYPFNGIEAQAVEYLEVQYGLKNGITPETIKANTAAKAQKIAIELAKELQKQKEENDKKLKQALLKIFLEAAKDNADLKNLITASKGVREKIDAIKAETQKLTLYWDKNKSAFDPDKMEERIRSLEKKLKAMDKALKTTSLEKCSHIEGWETQTEDALDGMETTFDRIRDIGKESREIVKKICDNQDDTAFVKKAMISLKKRFGLVGAKRNDAAAKRAEAVAGMKKLSELKDEIQSLLDRQKNISSSLDTIERWNKLVTAGQKNIDTPAETVRNLYGEIRQTMNEPVFERFRGKRGSIRYTLLGDADKAKKTFDELKAKAEAAIQKLSKSLSGVDVVKEELSRRQEDLEKALGECRTLKDLDLAQYESRIRQMDEKDKQFLAAFKKLNRKAKECAGEAGDDISDAALEEARNWLNKAREQSGLVSKHFRRADASGNALAGMQTSAEAALSHVSAPAANAAELIAACGQAQAKAQQLKSEIQSATGASAAQLAILKQNYEAAANARKTACAKAKSASSAKDKKQCEQAATQAMAQASTARQAAQKAAAAAEKMKSLYAETKAKSGVKSFDELLRKIPSAIQSLKDQIAKANDRLANVDPADIAEQRKNARKAAAGADLASRKVSDIAGIIRGLLAGIDPSLADKAAKISNEAEAMKSIATRENQLTAEAAGAAEAAADKIGTTVSKAKAKIKELSAMVDKLGNCRNVDIGGSLNELRTNSDVGEIFGPAAQTDAGDATICAEGAAEICKAMQTAGCLKDTDCPTGYVCENGECVSPFDDKYDDYTDTMTQRSDTRSQDQADQVASDQTSGPGRGYTSDDLSQDLADTQDALSRKCSKKFPCPAGYTCVDGVCVKDGKKDGKPDDSHKCPDGKIYKDGKCVDPPPVRKATLVISPANKVVVVNETLDLKGIYTDTSGKTHDVTGDSGATWQPGPSITKNEIGECPVSLKYKDLTANALITVVKEKGMEDITVNKKTITVTFWDHEKEDGDMIDILINGKAVFKGITLTNAPQSRTITMKTDIIVMGFRALNVGDYPPNTATVTFSDVTAGKEKQEYKLKKNQKANMNVNFKP